MVSGSRQCRRHADFQGVSWYTPATMRAPPAATGTHSLTNADDIAAAAIAMPATYAAMPNAVQITKYESPITHTSTAGCASPRNRTTRRYRSRVGSEDGSIIATIIAN